MKRIVSNISVTVAAAAMMIASQSCLKNDGYDMSIYSPNAIVTVKPLADGGFYMQLDEETTLFPANMTDSPYDEETRAFVNYTVADSDNGGYDYAVNVNWFSDILTKDMVSVPADSDIDIDAEYGNDPVDIMASWMTVIEDGYFTIHFETYSDGTGRKHKVNLVQPDPSDPYTLEFHHDADGDTYGSRVWSVAAFRLTDFGFTEGEEVTFTLKWDSFGQERSHQFKYTPGSAVASGEDTGTAAGDMSELSLE